MWPEFGPEPGRSNKRGRFDEKQLENGNHDEDDPRAIRRNTRPAYSSLALRLIVHADKYAPVTRAERCT